MPSVPRDYLGAGQDFDFTLQLRRQRRSDRKRRFFQLLVKPGRKKKELSVLESKPIAAFSDAPLAEHDALPATANRLTDDGPFFECHTHVVEFVLYTS